MTHKNQTPTQWLQQARDLIAQDRIDEVLGLLRSLFQNSPQLDELIHQSGRFANIRQQIRLGTVSHAEANLTRNQISAALLELIQEIETQQHEKPALRQEVEEAISVLQSKNVVAGSNTSAGRDLHIGDKTEKHYYYGGQSDAQPRSKWLKIGAAIVTVVGLFAAVAEISGYSLRDYWEKEESAPTISAPATDSEKTSQPSVPVSSDKAVQEIPKAKPDKAKATAPRNHFESHDSSKQINIPDNQGTITINQ